jgi:hypothetical protein
LAGLDGAAIRSNAFVRPQDFENRICPYCRKDFKPLRCHPNQVVCSSDDCQRRRRNDYHRKKVQKDPLYRLVCEDDQKTWKKQHPEYMKQYRARLRKAKAGRPAFRPVVGELLRLLSRVKNNLVKNTSAFRVTRCAPNTWLLTPKKRADDKNTSAPTHVILIHGITPDE